MAMHRMAMRRRIARETAGRGPGRLKETPLIVAVRRRDSAAHRPTVRMAPAHQDRPHMRTDRRGWVLETPGRLHADTSARMRQLITKTGHRIRRRMVAVAMFIRIASPRRPLSPEPPRVTS